MVFHTWQCSALKIIHSDHEMKILIMQHIKYQNVSIKIHKKKYKILVWYINEYGIKKIFTHRFRTAVYNFISYSCTRLRLKCDGTRAETRFHLSAKRTNPFKSAGASVQLTAGSQGVRISNSNVGYTIFRGSVKSSGYPLHLPVSPSLVLPCAITFQLDSTKRWQ